MSLFCLKSPPNSNKARQKRPILDPNRLATVVVGQQYQKEREREREEREERGELIALCAFQTPSKYAQCCRPILLRFHSVCVYVHIVPTYGMVSAVYTSQNVCIHATSLLLFFFLSSFFFLSGLRWIATAHLAKEGAPNFVFPLSFPPPPLSLSQLFSCSSFFMARS